MSGEPPNTEALLATVREALAAATRYVNKPEGYDHLTPVPGTAVGDAHLALDAIASELEQAWKDYEVQREYADEQYRKALAAEAELERVRAERDEKQREVNAWRELGYPDELKRLQARLDRAVEALRRLRQWDMLNSYIGGDGERHEPTADAPYWRGEIDRVLAEIEESG